MSDTELSGQLSPVGNVDSVTHEEERDNADMSDNARENTGSDEEEISHPPLIRTFRIYSRKRDHEKETEITPDLQTSMEDLSFTRVCSTPLGSQYTIPPMMSTQAKKPRTSVIGPTDSITQVWRNYVSAIKEIL